MCVSVYYVTMCLLLFSFLKPRRFEPHEVTLTFKDSGHGGDKRKRCQPCDQTITGTLFNILSLSSLSQASLSPASQDSLSHDKQATTRL